ncbi:hypothetical protein GHT06_007916 [Daphnia sinensis]|uniref:Uncharacterized protein n=1 Tax=Daphnia sinensis TaxID=1820382 RepID=A0AAD5Q068_9CRUS|nr:hypothetical protein GHT06_007916 [Daphnia sinensis]
MIYPFPCLEKLHGVRLVRLGGDGYADLLHSLLNIKTQRMCVYPLSRSANVADIIGR